jgi:hypothetical protein
MENEFPRGLAPTRSWTWEVGSSQLFRAAFVKKESRPSRWDTAAVTSFSRTFWGSAGFALTNCSRIEAEQFHAYFTRYAFRGRFQLAIQRRTNHDLEATCACSVTPVEQAQRTDPEN